MKITVITFVCFISIGIMVACNNAQPTLSTSTPEEGRATTLETTIKVETVIPPTSTYEPTNNITFPTSTPTAELNEKKPVIERLDEGEVVTLTSINMMKNKTGWGVGNYDNDDHILRTLDGGGNWLDVTPPESSLADDGIGKRAMSFFLDGENGWVTYYPGQEFQFEPSSVWFTSDGGESWEESSPLDGTGLDTFFEPRQLYFHDEFFGWLMLGHDRGVGNAPVTIYRTADGGRNWDRVTDPFTDENSGFIHICCQTGMVFTDSKTGLITSQDGPVETAYVNWTYDGGLSWQEQVLPPADENLFSRAWCGTRSPVVRAPQSIVLVVECLDASQEPALNVAFLYSSEDNGQTWEYSKLPVPPIEKGTWDYLRRTHNIDFLNQDLGWAFTSDFYQLQGGEESNALTHIYHSVDGGVSWEEIKTVAWMGDFSYIDLQNGWAAAFSDDENALVRTVDEGRTWQMMTPQVASDSNSP